MSVQPFFLQISSISNLIIYLVFKISASWVAFNVPVTGKHLRWDLGSCAEQSRGWH